MKNLLILFGLIFELLMLESFGENMSLNNNYASINSDQHSIKKNSLIDPNSSPENVMNTIFKAAKSGEVGVLKFLLPPFDDKIGKIPCDGDCKALCNAGNESMREELKGNYVSIEDFKKYFEKGKIIGVPTINGNRAQVNFVFGPNLERNETMNMQKINNKWYLSSF